MPARVFCKIGELKGMRQDFTEELVLGRSTHCSLRLNVAMVSAQHARISWRQDAGGYVLEDLGSTNGTRLDGIRVSEPEPLGHLHVITLAGAYDFIFQDLERCAERHARSGLKDAEPPEGEHLGGSKTMIQEALPSLPAMIAALPSGGDPTIRTRVDLEIPALPGNLAPPTQPEMANAEVHPAEKTQRGLELPMQLPDFLKASPATPASPEVPVIAADTVDLDEPVSPGDEPDVAETPISQSKVVRLMLGEPHKPGSRLELELQLTDDEVKRYPLPEGKSLFGRGTEATLQVESLEVSRLHAELIVEEGRVQIRDLGSRNHTFVNDIQTEGTVEIPADAELRFGNLVARLVPANSSSTEA